MWSYPGDSDPLRIGWCLFDLPHQALLPAVPFLRFHSSGTVCLRHRPSVHLDFQREFGPVNTVLRSIGLDSWTRSWLSDASVVYFVVMTL